jgi:site-specific recombinase XerD
MKIGPTVAATCLTASDPYLLALRNVALLEVLFATGIRVGELVSLTLADWSEDDASFVVKGKGSRQRLAFLPDHRSVTALKDYLGRRRTLKVDHDAVFISATGRRLSEQGVARMLANLAPEAGITNRLTPHMIRHTVATLLLRQGADIRVVQEILGHSSIATTQRYTEVSKEHMRATLRAHHPSHHMGINASLQSTLF